jgi:hypothetical protein
LDIFISISSSGCFQDIKRRLVWQQMVLEVAGRGLANAISKLYIFISISSSG